MKTGPDQISKDEALLLLWKMRSTEEDADFEWWMSPKDARYIIELIEKDLEDAND